MALLTISVSVNIYIALPNSPKIPRVGKGARTQAELYNMRGRPHQLRSKIILLIKVKILCDLTSITNNGFINKYMRVNYVITRLNYRVK